MRSFIGFLISFFILTASWAETTAPLTAETVNPSPHEFNWRNFSGGIIFSPFDLLIPRKFGVQIDYAFTDREIWEIEYLRGTIAAPFFIEDIGSLRDERLSFGKRRFSKSGFNYSYALTYFRFKAHIGGELLNRSGESDTSRIDLVQLESVGVRAGVGHRWWLSEHFFWGVDWIELNQPLVITKDRDYFTDNTDNGGDKKDVDMVKDWASYFPRLNVLKLYLSYKF